MPRFSRILRLVLVLFPVTVADADARLLLEIDGVELHGTEQLLMSGAGTCNVLESDTSYEERRANHGAPMDVWRLDFSVHNGSGRWLDHLVARFAIDSKWPDCTNWSGPDPVDFMLEHGTAMIDWAGAAGFIQESGRNVVAPGATLRDTEFIIVLRGDPSPRFTNWSLDFDFGSTGSTDRDASGDPQAVEAALGLDRPTRRLIQHGLLAGGFDPGVADGLFGPVTRAAIRRWQDARGMATTGYLDGAALMALRVIAEEAARAARRQVEPEVDPQWQASLQATLRRMAQALAEPAVPDAPPGRPVEEVAAPDSPRRRAEPRAAADSPPRRTQPRTAPVTTDARRARAERRPAPFRFDATDPACGIPRGEAIAFTWTNDSGYWFACGPEPECRQDGGLRSSERAAAAVARGARPTLVCNTNSDTPVGTVGGHLYRLGVALTSRDVDRRRRLAPYHLCLRAKGMYRSRDACRMVTQP